MPLRPIAAALLLTILAPAPADAQQGAAETAPDRKPVLRVATKIAEPFVMQRPSGELEGVSIDLWERIAGELDVAFEYEVVDLETLIEGVANNQFDVGVGALSITADREQRLDLTHGYFLSGLGIAVPAGRTRAGWLSAFASVFTIAFASAVGALALLLLAVGVVVWIVERKRNPAMFGGGLIRGVGAGFWFSAVTMTTVGYGDKAPITPLGRIVTLIWMFGSIIVISAFTGAIASALTTARIDTGVRGPEDLRDVSVGALDASAPADSLRNRGVVPRPFDSLDEGLRALAQGEIDAFVHDRPILHYTIARDFPGRLHLLEAQFDLASYALAMPQGSELVEPVNRRLLEVTRSPEWSDILLGYFTGRN